MNYFDEKWTKKVEKFGKWIVWKNNEIIAITTSYKIIKSGVNFGSIFHICWCFSPISINQSAILMKKIRKWSKQNNPKKDWFHNEEISLFCRLKK